jgi:YaiO family outer membrane protein
MFRRAKRRAAPASLLALALAVGLLALRASGASAGEATLEIGGEAAALSDGLGDWGGLYGILSYVATPSDRLTLELAYASRFGEQGGGLTGTWQRDYNPDSYQVFSLTGSSAGLFWPSAGLSTEYFRKLGSERDWVLGGGGGVNGYRTGNDDYFGVLEAIRYFPSGWVAEAGTRLNLSEPGSVAAPRAFAALTWLPAAGHEYVLKVDGGDEAYQIVGPGDLQTRFTSFGVTGEAFVPIGGGRRIHARVERYVNPFYDRWLGYLGISQVF